MTRMYRNDTILSTKRILTLAALLLLFLLAVVPISHASNPNVVAGSWYVYYASGGCPTGSSTWSPTTKDGGGFAINAPSNSNADPEIVAGQTIYIEIVVNGGAPGATVTYQLDGGNSPYPVPTTFNLDSNGNADVCIIITVTTAMTQAVTPYACTVPEVISVSGDGSGNLDHLLLLGGVAGCEAAQGTSQISTAIVDEGPGSLTPGSPPTALAGDSFHDTATLVVTGDGGANPTGTVTYFFYTTGDCTGSYTTSTGTVGGTAASPTVGDSDSTGPLAAGSYSFKATYSGDSNYGFSGSTCEPLTVTGVFGQPPTVVKTADGTFTTTYVWDVTKTVDNTQVYTAGGASATVNYEVDVTHDSGTISDIVVSGTITVINPNTQPMTVTITDTLDDGTVCSVTGGTGAIIAADSSQDFSYSCADSGDTLPSTNSASVSWDSGGSNGVVSTGPVSITTFSNDIVNGCVDVVDSLEGTLGTVCYNDPSPTTFSYPYTFTDPAGTCTSHDNTVTVSNAVGDSLATDSQTVTDCQGADLVVTKTASPTFTRTYTWDVAKAASPLTAYSAGGSSVTFSYDVTVTHDLGTDSDWAVSGTITVHNPNDWEAITFVLSDVVDNGGSCSIDGGEGPYTVAAGATSTFSYSCTFTSGDSGTNTATATWDAETFSTPDASASGSAGFSFTTPTTIVDGSVDVTDSVQGNLGTVSYTDPSPTDFSYQVEVSDPAGTCTTHTNTVTITPSDTSTTSTASQTVQDCQGADLTVTKTASASFLRTYTWGIDKTVDKNHAYTQAGASATFDYTVSITHDSGTDSDWLVTGAIHIVNPNDWEAIDANVGDAVDNGGSCTVATDTVTVPASGSVDVAYSCTYPSAPSPSAGTNTATVTWDDVAYHTPSDSATGTATFDFSAISPTLVDDFVTVTDTQGGALGTVYYTDPSPKTFTYSQVVSDPIGVCTDHTNTATFTTDTTGTTGSASQTVTDCQTIGFVSDTSLCPITSSRLVLIQDGGSTYDLQASNPGQYYYNFFYVGAASAGDTFTATIPFPFVTQGANPSQVFDASLYPRCGGQVPGSNYNSLFLVSPSAITISSYKIGLGNTTDVTFTVGAGGLPAGNYWFAIHLNYGLKGSTSASDFYKITTGFSKGPTPAACTSNAPCAQWVSHPWVILGNPETYTFSNSQSGDATLQTVNHFNKDPGFAGIITTSDGTPIANVAVNIYLNGKFLATVYTNDDGVYSYNYKYTGSAVSYTVSATYGGVTKSVSGTMKSNQLVTNNFVF